ncbi:MAG: hypothetical protein H7211_02780 [Aquabacterium sp.]|nr:hypothetical protein [Ferruginibacter sp.]
MIKQIKQHADNTNISHHLPEMQTPGTGRNANGRLLVFLYMRTVPHKT